MFKFNSDSYFPNSVVMWSSPCWGTMRKSPSLLYMARLFMELLHVYTWTAIPCLVLLSPAPVIHHRRHYLSCSVVSIGSPATVWRPSTQSTLSFLGISKGFHLIWFGFGGWSLHFVVRNLHRKMQVTAAMQCKILISQVTCGGRVWMVDAWLRAESCTARTAGYSPSGRWRRCRWAALRTAHTSPGKCR